MQAFLLSAGHGKRLRPITINQPKCLVKIGRTNLLELWVKKLNQVRVKKIIINVAKKLDQCNKIIILIPAKK